MPGDKGSYRSVYSAIWDDPEFQGFDLLTRQVFLYLRTNKDCNFPCIYVFYPSILAEYFRSEKQASLDRVWGTLSRTLWIRYERPILWITKGLKNEPNFSHKSEQQKSGIINILKTLPKLKIINDFTEYYEINFKVEIPSPIPSPIPLGEQGTGTGTGTGTVIKDQKPPRKKRTAKCVLNATPEALKIYDYYCREVRDLPTSKARALKNIDQHLSSGETPHLLWECINNYIDDIQRKKTEEQYRQVAANFFGINEPGYIGYREKAKTDVEKTYGQANV